MLYTNNVENLNEKQGVLTVLFNDDPEIMRLYYFVRKELIKCYNEGITETEFKAPFKYKEKTIDLTIKYHLNGKTSFGSCEPFEKIITFYIDVMHEQFPYTFFHELQHCLLDPKKVLEPVYSAITDDMEYSDSDDFNRYKKLYLDIVEKIYKFTIYVIYIFLSYTMLIYL